MKAKEFEELCLYRMRQHEERGEATMSRYGVQGVYMMDPATQQMKWQPVSSLPDFEGLIPGGRQFTFDCKVCAAASFPLDNVFFKKRQLRHMNTRARFGAICFLLIHFSERVLKTKTESAETWAFPVSPDHSFWIAFDRGETKRITREDCKEYGIQIDWDVLPGGRIARPNVLAAIRIFNDHKKEVKYV